MGLFQYIFFTGVVHNKRCKSHFTSRNLSASFQLHKRFVLQNCVSKRRKKAKYLNECRAHFYRLVSYTLTKEKKWFSQRNVQQHLFMQCSFCEILLICIRETNYKYKKAKLDSLMSFTHKWWITEFREFIGSKFVWLQTFKSVQTWSLFSEFFMQASCIKAFLGRRLHNCKRKILKFDPSF